MDSNVMLQIARLEAQQLRPMRELAIDPAAAQALARLHSIEQQIGALRQTLSTAVTAAASSA